MLRCVVVVAISALAALLRLRLLITMDSNNQDDLLSEHKDLENGRGSGNSDRRSIRTDTGEGSSWTESHSPPSSSSDQSSTTAKKQGKDIRISFRLHDPMDVPHPTQFLSVEKYKCLAALPPSLSGRAHLSFTTTISTNLNILFLGDSVAQQFAQGFYASVLGEGNYGGHIILDAFQMGNRAGLHVDKSLVAPTRGGGACAYWRALALMNNGTMGYVDFLGQQGEELVNYRYAYPAGDVNTLVKNRTTKLPSGAETTHFQSELHRNDTEQTFFEVGKIDACVIRLPHGWIQLQDITRDRLVQHINLCNKVVGAPTVIISTLPLNNNVETPYDWQDLIKINQIIRDIAQSWKPPSHGDDGVRVVLVQEFGNFTNQILWKNAQFIGYNISMPDFAMDGWEKEGTDFLLHRYSPDQQYAPSIPMVCGHPLDSWSAKNETPPKGPCLYNMISRDGMHWCIESLGPRYSASIACLLGCVYNGKHPDDITTKNVANVRQCEQECNDQLMSLVPVDGSWIGTNTTIYSK